MDMGIQQQLVLQKIGKREATKKFLPIINCLFSIFQCATILIIMINIFYPPQFHSSSFDSINKTLVFQKLLKIFQFYIQWVLGN